MRINKQLIISFILVTGGSFLYAGAINMVAVPNNLGEGGVTGIALLCHYLLGMNTGVVNFVLNAILIVIGWRYLERDTLYWTIYSVIMVSLFLDYAHFYAFIPENKLLVPIVGGLFNGLGLGIVMLGRGTTAGLDIVAKIVEKYLGIKVPVTVAVLDAVIIMPFIMIIGLENVIITLINVFIVSRTMTFVLEGFNPRKSLMIISKEYEAIGDEITEEINRGITVLEGSGFYSGIDRPVLYTVIDRRQLMKVQRIIYRHDPSAFVSIADIQQVIGEGFTFYLNPSEVNHLE